MKKISYSFLAVLLLGLQMSFAQTWGSSGHFPVAGKIKNLIAPGSSVSAKIPFPQGLAPNGLSKDRCGFVTQRNRALAAGYDEAAFERAVNNKIAEIRAARAAGRTEASINYIIPVIFHIINDGTAEGVGANVAASQVYEQISQLNKDYGNQSGSPFAVAASSGISFCPVLQDPSGNTLAQPGIERLNRITRGWTNPTTFTDPGDGTGIDAMIAYIDASIKPVTIWNPGVYVNIWAYDFSNSGLLGYATFPTAGTPDLGGGGEDASTAGAVFLSGALGSVASPGGAGTHYGLGRTITHELGHFFGLYHPWGDVTDCSGTDYCADTPPCSDQYYSTSPGCTAPVQCSGATRMIQDYMDYSDDGCMNTFTQNQVDRMQAVMSLAPRRPRNPGATLCTPAVSDAISFTTATASYNIAETGTGTCPKYKDYLVTVQPAVAASGNATVSFTFSGTATQDVDYSVIGSTSFSYTNGDAAAKSFTIRILDDADIEPTETILINFNVTGTGLVPSTVNLTSTFTITDDDVASYVNNTTQSTQLLSETFTGGTSGALPSGWSKVNVLATAGANVWTVNPVYGASTGFTTVANGRVLHITNGTTTQQSAETAAATYNQTSESDVFVITKPIVTTGYGNIKLSFDYACFGDLYQGSFYDYGVVYYSTTSSTAGFLPATDASGNVVLLAALNAAKHNMTVTLPVSVANAPNLWIAFEWYNDNSVRANPPLILDNIVVTGENIGVESTAGQSATNTQNTGQGAQYISGSSKMIAEVSNLSANVGCITASVASAGTSLQTLNINTGTYQRSDKVIQISPAVANSTASYKVTLYYTTAELLAWGGSVSSLKILKVKDGVALNSTLTGANAALFTAAVDDQRAAKGYASFTANVTGGFSQFMLASPATVLPVSLIDFNAKAGNKVINLTWSTSSELNNRGFAIERSTDGNTYERIGWVDGNNTTSTASSYSYTDSRVQAGIVYYYRLVQTNIDGREALSEVRKASLSNAGVLITLSPNPAKDLVKISIAGSTGTGIIRLLDEKGGVLKTEKASFTGAPYLFNIKSIASGVYFVQVQLSNALSTEKLIIQ